MQKNKPNKQQATNQQPKKHLGGTEKFATLSSGFGLHVETFLKKYENSSFVGFSKNIRFHTGLPRKGGNFLEKLSFYATLISKLFI